ncbi:MAG: hypothetical protein ACE5FS_15120 [Paracoccaceae bacterium]
MNTVIKTLAVAAVSAAALMGPAHAMTSPTQLELSAGIDAVDYGTFSVAELAQIKFASETENNE